MHLRYAAYADATCGRKIERSAAGKMQLSVELGTFDPELAHDPLERCACQTTAFRRVRDVPARALQSALVRDERGPDLEPFGRVGL